MSDYSYIQEKDVPIVRERALFEAKHSDDLWGFLHSTLIDIVEHQGGKHQKGYDGFFTMKEFDVSGAATRLQIALEERDEFLRDRAENDKSG